MSSLNLLKDKMYAVDAVDATCKDAATALNTLDGVTVCSGGPGPRPAVPARRSRSGGPGPAVPFRRSRSGGPGPRLAVPARRSRPGGPRPGGPRGSKVQTSNLSFTICHFSVFTFLVAGLGMGANRTRIRELTDSQPILLICIDLQFARHNLQVGESKKDHNFTSKIKK